MAEFQVRKRGGTLENWSVDKVINSVAVAGVTMKEAEAIGALIEAWAKRSAENKVISSIKTRDKVIEILGAVDATAANIYKAYKK